MMGGAWFQDTFSQSPTDSEIEQAALDAIEHNLGIKQNPTMCHASICKVCKYTLQAVAKILNGNNHITHVAIKLL